MSLTLKLSSLAVRTLAKPIANYIKSQAREHEKFRRICVNFAQRLHRIDMRMRLGLLTDPASIDRRIQREAEAEAKKKKRQEEAKEARERGRQRQGRVYTAKTEEETKAEADEMEREKHKIEDRMKKEREAKEKQHIRPLSEAKAIDSGATFISETFLFMVAAGLIVTETVRRGGKEKDRQADVAERLDQLEGEVRRAEEVEDELKVQVESLEAEIVRLKGGSPNGAPEQHKEGSDTQQKPATQEAVETKDEETKKTPAP